MIHKGTDGIRASEIHAQPHTRIFQHPAIEEWDIDGVSQKGLIDRDAGPIQQQKVDLMNVKCVQFRGTVLDDPVLYVALPDHDVRHA